MQIRKIISNGKVYYRQDEISKAISNFYKELYKKQENLEKTEVKDNIFEGLPKLNDTEKTELEKPVTINELYNTLSTCRESAPGPDGISYEVYKNTWEISGQIIMMAWNHSIRIGQTSQTQRQAVITLLEKKGKDKCDLLNLRPISLSNCDIKICTKTIALRTNRILEKLLSDTQTGYVPGRQVTNNSRLIEEIIELTNKSDDEAYLITLDAQKAFDSVDHDYLLKVLQAYNFPESYINWVKVIYTNLEASVLVNGYTTTKFKIEQSVKQGDALSCALFVLAIEPLLRNIQKNEEITPIKISSQNGQLVEIKKAGFADDITCITASQNSLQVIIDEYNRFSSKSGIKLNVKKTEILVIGNKSGNLKSFKLKHKGEEVVILEQKSVKICGITFSNDCLISYRENILDRITKLERQLNIWRQRNLSLEGKILITKTFGLSQMIYAMQSTFIKMEDLKKIDNILYRFIWNLKTDNQIVIGKISRKTMVSEFVDGGLRAPDVYAIDKAIKYKALLANHSQKHPIKLFYEKKLESFGFDYCNYKSNNAEDSFLGKAIKTHVDSFKVIRENIRTLGEDTEGIHKNYYALIQNYDLRKSVFTNVRQNNMIMRLNAYNINTFQKLHEEKQMRRYPALFLDVHQIYSMYPDEWKSLIVNTRRLHEKVINQVNVGLNKWVERDKVKLKILTSLFTNTYENRTVNALLMQRHPELLENNIRMNPFLTLRVVKDVKLRNLQFKMLHNIYPTMKHLKRWRIKESENCGSCGEIETFKHAVFDCQIAKNSFKNMEDEINARYFNGTHNIELTLEDITLGVSATKSLQSLNKEQAIGIDIVLILLKQRLILQREAKFELTREDIVSLFEERYRIDKYNSKVYKKGNSCKIDRRWGK